MHFFIYAGFGFLLGLVVAFLVTKGSRAQAQQQLAELEVLKNKLQGHEDKQEYFKELLQQSRLQFENLAHQIFEQKQQTFQQQTQQQVGLLLSPVKEQMEGFHRSIHDFFQTEIKEKSILKGEINRLIIMHEKMAGETQALSRALTMDNKFQGDWGEMVLERILESAGLREGEEYRLQMSATNAEGTTYRPDVVVLLPDQKHIIIDSKVSLKAFTQLQNEVEHLASNHQMIKAHIDSLESHIQQLAQKKYDTLEGLGSPDFVFMFVPVEAAWLVALRHQPDLGAKAWSKGVAIVTASTLFAGLRTVANLWRIEKQNRNAQKIAEEAGSLYDKMAAFMSDFEKMGLQLRSLESQYDDLRGRLASGRGNILGRFDKIKNLGAKANKTIALDFEGDADEGPSEL